MRKRILRPLVALCAIGMSLGAGIPAAFAQYEADPQPLISTGTNATSDLSSDAPMLLSISNAYPRSGYYGFQAPNGSDYSEITSLRIDLSNKGSVKMPTSAALVAASPKGQWVLHPEYHANQGFSGDRDYEFIGWSKRANLVVGQKVGTDGHCSVSVADHNGNYRAGQDSTSVPKASGSCDYWWYQNPGIYALYKQVVRYNANGGTGTMQSTSGTLQNMKWGDGHDSDFDDASATYTLAENKFTRSGYKFVGWSTSPSGSGTIYQPGKQITRRTSSYATYGGYFLYAKWQKLITVTYDGNGATGGSTPAHADIGAGDTITIRQSGFTWANHEFTGWNTKKDGSGTSYRPNDKNAFSSNTTLYAQWKTLNATIHYDGNGATSGTVADQTDQIGKTVQVQQNGFTRDSYIFKQWNTKPDGTGTAYAPTADVTIPANGMTLYAIWTPVSTTMPSTGGKGLMLSLGGGIAGLLVCLATLMLRRKRRS